MTPLPITDLCIFQCLKILTYLRIRCKIIVKNNKLLLLGEIMNYNDFCCEINNYLDLYRNGLKKQANAKMAITVSNINSLPNPNQDIILFRFLSEYCDNDIWDPLKKRGNGFTSGDMPYQLKEYILSLLTPRCEEKKMPELRWYYELFINHKIGYKYAVQYLEYAYASKDCDQKTIDFLFDSYIGTLAWGAHHFPDGCIIKKETIANCIQQCETIMNEKAVSSHLIEELHYFKTLYACFEKYTADGRMNNFQHYLSEAGIQFP